MITTDVFMGQGIGLCYDRWPWRRHASFKSSGTELRPRLSTRFEWIVRFHCPAGQPTARSSQEPYTDAIAAGLVGCMTSGLRHAKWLHLNDFQRLEFAIAAHLGPVCGPPRVLSLARGESASGVGRDLAHHMPVKAPGDRGHEAMCHRPLTQLTRYFGEVL